MLRGLKSMPPSFLPTQLTPRGVSSPFGDAVDVCACYHGACVASHLYFGTCLITTVLFPEGASARWPFHFRREKHPKLFSWSQPCCLFTIGLRRKKKNPHCPIWNSSSTHSSPLTDSLTSPPVMILSTQANLPVSQPSFTTWLLLFLGPHSFLVFYL